MASRSACDGLLGFARDDWELKAGGAGGGLDITTRDLVASFLITAPLPSKDPRLDAYIANSAPFARPILKHLRKIVHTGCPEVEETMKWSMPHFDYKGVLCAMAAFKAHCTFSFWKGSLVLGKEEVAEEKAMGQFGRITALSHLPSEKVLLGYVRKAAALNDAGVKSPERPKSSSRRENGPVEVPSYFRTALNKNAAASKTFDSFSASKQKDYIEWVTEAKRDATRQQRLATSLEWLAQSKPRMWKYLPQG